MGREQSHGKAQPFRTSGGKAAEIRAFRICVDTNETSPWYLGIEFSTSTSHLLSIISARALLQSGLPLIPQRNRRLGVIVEVRIARLPARPAPFFFIDLACVPAYIAVDFDIPIL